MKDNTANFNDLGTQEEGIDVKKITYLLLRHWYWFALFGAMGLIGAFGYTKLTTPNYQANTSILVPEESNGMDMQDLFQGGSGQNSNNIFNQIEIIKSYKIVNQTILNLNWRTNWYEKGMFLWHGIYRYEPFDVQEASDFINPKGIKIFITPKSGNSYTVKVDSKIYINNSLIKVKFVESGEYGRPFKNKYFNFTLLKKNSDFDQASNNEYYFVFNDLNASTRSYQARLSASLTDKKGDIIECSLQSDEPNRAVEFLNELIEVYSETKLEFQNEAQRRSLDFINTQLAGISDSIRIAGANFADFRSKNNIIDLSAEGNMVMNNLTEIESERAKNQAQLEYFQNLLRYLNSASDLKQLVAPSVVGIQDASFNNLVVKLGELYNRRQVISFSARENNPTLINIDRELNQTKSQLTENLKNLIDNAVQNINSQKERQDKISVQLNRLPQKEQKMVNIQRQFNLTNELYTFLLQKRTETNISLASSTSDVQVIDVARPEQVYRVGLGQTKILMIGLILGFSLPMAYILLLGFFDTRIRTQTDLEKNTSIPILGNIMHSPTKSDLIVHENPKSNIAESFRALRTNLQYMLTGSDGKVISILSTNPGEGKSFSAINLASILAVNNKKVLIIGADMRKPRLHKAFGLPNESGLSSYLIGNNSLEQVIVSTPIGNLSFLPSGPIPPNPAEILGKPELKTLIDWVRSRFDFVIIDNAPTAMVTDGQIVSHLSDLNIFVLRYGVSHIHQLDLINQYVEKSTISNIGIIVNDIKTNSFGHSYYKYYQYESYQNTYYSDEKPDKKGSRKNT